MEDQMFPQPVGLQLQPMAYHRKMAIISTAYIQEKIILYQIIVQQFQKEENLKIITEVLRLSYLAYHLN
jgi:hypothetical protein